MFFANLTLLAIERCECCVMVMTSFVCGYSVGHMQIIPGMVVCGMEVAEVFGSPRMGPTFGAMFVSGQKAAAIALEVLERLEAAELSTAHMEQRTVANIL
mmetsp:Transcript_36653/g.61777  ORF Transcript_36653/g.61777 Transcript_36653/m.61777 type:complete len:100 (+) Transcript_36653:2450-2749(+)